MIEAFKNCFQQRLIFYGAPVFHHDLAKFFYNRVVCSDKRSGFPKTRPRTPIILDFVTSWLKGTREIRINLKMSPIIKNNN